MQCPRCNMTIKDDATFCMHCGTRFGGVGAEIPQVQPQNNVVQSATPQQETDTQVEKYVKRERNKNIFTILIILLLVVGAYFGINKYLKDKEMNEKIEAEFTKESDEYFKNIARFAKMNILRHDGNYLSTNEFYYVLIDSNINDKEHPLTTIEAKDKKYFDGKGYVVIIMGEGVNQVDGFVCLNNGNGDKRYISTKTLDPDENKDENSQNAFHKLNLSKKGKCDISKLKESVNQSLYQITLEY